MANNINTAEMKRIRKLLNKSYLKAESLLQDIYKYEYLFRVNEGEGTHVLSDEAHDAKDELLKELDTVDGIMSLNMRPTTRKRKRNNNNNSNNNSNTRSRRSRSGSSGIGSFPL